VQARQRRYSLIILARGQSELGQTCLHEVDTLLVVCGKSLDNPWIRRILTTLGQVDCSESVAMLACILPDFGTRLTLDAGRSRRQSLRLLYGIPLQQHLRQSRRADAQYSLQAPAHLDP
jgi:hypothetical protein